MLTLRVKLRQFRMRNWHNLRYRGFGIKLNKSAGLSSDSPMEHTAMRRLARRIAGVRILAAEQRPLASRWQGEGYSPQAKFPKHKTFESPQTRCFFHSLVTHPLIFPPKTQENNKILAFFQNPLTSSKQNVTIYLIHTLAFCGNIYRVLSNMGMTMVF